MKSYNNNLLPHKWTCLTSPIHYKLKCEAMADKKTRLWDSLSELRSFLCERRPEKRQFRGPALLPVKTAQFAPFFSFRYDITQ